MDQPVTCEPTPLNPRRVRLDPEEDEFIDPEKPMVLSLYGELSKKSGYARLMPGEMPETLVWKAKAVGALRKAKEAEVYAYIEQDFDDSPDVFVAGPDLGDARQVTRTNPFQKDYLWGHSELVDFESQNGEALQGAGPRPTSSPRAWPAPR